jgi:hypothetical protein
VTIAILRGTGVSKVLLFVPKFHPLYSFSFTIKIICTKNVDLAQTLRANALVY